MKNGRVNDTRPAKREGELAQTRSSGQEGREAAEGGAEERNRDGERRTGADDESRVGVGVVVRRRPEAAVVVLGVVVVF